MDEKVKKTDAEWREILSPQAYGVLREKRTERAFTGKYDDFHDDGIYRCAACGEPTMVSRLVEIEGRQLCRTCASGSQA